ncbi:hypothetical protein AXF42_Ash010834 [Apostasia shenzhenica]|uniref:AAA+ ATPase domain-containing protein n=1 Tax=Apostasia shenzhenica TaxID=1088818 RepID=A0A2I0A0T8_9ASPA|nr:hypothetical protein AXF42_Ash010834 [Apostasia shenzhenica]
MDRSSEDQLAEKRPRRCVQSKLSFGVSHRGKGSGNAVGPTLVVAVEDGTSNSEWSDSEGKRKRYKKSKPVDRPPEKYSDNSKREEVSRGCRKKVSYSCLKNRQSGDETPTKITKPKKLRSNGSSSMKMSSNEKLNDLKDHNEKNLKTFQPFCDLWSEAKKAAEENFRLSAGKETHPFFSICHATKRSLEAKLVEKADFKSHLSVDGDYCTSLPPVHIFDNRKDAIAAPDWTNWKFVETSPARLNGYCNTEFFKSAFECSAQPLKLEAACGKDIYTNTIRHDESENLAFGAAQMTELSGGHTSNQQPHVSCGCSCQSASSAVGMDQDGMHKRRLLSFDDCIDSISESNLWVDKYRPRTSPEVCGNAESVKLLSEWLKSWHERGMQSFQNDSSVKHSTSDCSEESSCDTELDLDEIIDEDTLKNVLLITGPVGSGKSAAIYACAREQGFKVIEVNASNFRSGAYMRQTFAEAVDSLGLTHWLAEDEKLQKCKHVMEQQPVPDAPENEFEVHSMEKAPKICSQTTATEKISDGRIAKRTLFLFEEVDIVFDEDRGFISTILKLAETTKRPMILTSNNKKPDLPKLLDRMVLHFKAPSGRELLNHMSMVCAFENVRIPCCLLEHIIKAFLGDIRRIMMLLQFWCQGMQERTDSATQSVKRLIPFDISAAHFAIPKVIPWDFGCELSEKLEEEISKTASALEENSWFTEAIKINSMVHPSEKTNTPMKSRRKGRLRKNSLINCTELSDQIENLKDEVYDSDSLSTGGLRTAKRKPGIVLSSQSDDGLSSDEFKPLDVSILPEGYDLQAIPTFSSQTGETCENLQIDSMNTFRAESSILDLFSSSECTVPSCLLEYPIMFSESSLISEPETITTLVPKSISDNGNMSFFDLSTSADFMLQMDANDLDNAPQSSKNLKCHVGAAVIDMESIQSNMNIVDLQHDAEDHNPRDNISYSQEVASVSETWRKWKNVGKNSKLLSTSCKDVSVITNFTSKLADLVSETDIMFRSSNPIIHHNFMSTSISSGDADCFSWHEELLEMGSIYAEHGLCFYTMQCAAAGSSLGRSISADVVQEMLAASTNSGSLGKLLTQESKTDQSSCFRDSDIRAPQSCMLAGRENEAELYSAILPIVPARLSMVLRGAALHEYLSFMGQISSSDQSRLAEISTENPKRSSRLN